MPRKKIPNLKPKPPSRPKHNIDWDRVDELLIAGCPGTKIAPSLGICEDTLYLRCVSERGMTFTELTQAKRRKGEAILHEVQFKKAIGATKEGDNTLLIWLGKNRCDQKEYPVEANVSVEIVNQYEALMNQIKDAQSSDNIEYKSETSET